MDKSKTKFKTIEGKEDNNQSKLTNRIYLAMHLLEQGLFIEEVVQQTQLGKMTVAFLGEQLAAQRSE